MTAPYDLLIFTDLDGTLLDHHTYSYEQALSALEDIRQRGVPLILVSSKTKKEMENYRNELQLPWPIIVENGSAIFFPDIFCRKWELPDCLLLLGGSYGELQREFHQLQAQFPLRSLHEYSIHQLTELTGLKPEQVKDALQREFSIPFLTEKELPEEDWKKLEETIHQKNLRILRGGRFYHLLGNTGKGTAMKRLLAFLQELGISTVQPVTAAFGDAPNDVELLTEVQIPIVVEKPGGGYRIDQTAFPHFHYVKGIGPEGWSRAYFSLIRPLLEKKGGSHG